jgi:hypothetical protein
LINLHYVSNPLHRHHQELVDAGLPDNLKAPVFADLNVSSFERADVARGKAAWQSRILEAYGLVQRYTRFSADVARMGASSDFLGMATRAVWDKNCHLELCCRMTQALGGTLKLRSTADFLNAANDRSPRSSLLCTLMGPICIEENISIRVLSAMAQHTKMETAKAIILRVASEEALHWRMGWVMLETIWPTLGDEEEEELLGGLEKRFVLAEKRFYLSRVGTGATALNLPAGAPSHSFGSLGLQMRSRIVEDAIRDSAERFFRLGVPREILAKHLEQE